MTRLVYMVTLAIVFPALAASSASGKHVADTTAHETRTVAFASGTQRDYVLDDLPSYRHQTVSRARLAIALTGVAVYDFAFYQTLKKPWWSGEPSDFHIVNDWWGNYSLEVDKLAHAYAGQSMTLISAQAYEWTGMTRRQALLWGGVTSLLTLTQVEILDGFTKKFGFSPGDYAANIAGAFYPLAQEVWSPLRVVNFKMSYHGRRFEPNAYTGLSEPNRLEDYNRQTFWLAVHMKSILPEPVRGWWPSWLQLAAGYGVDGAFMEDRGARTREYYLGLDFDPSRIDTGIAFLDTLFAPFRYIHLPAPCVRFREDGTRVFALYF